MKDEASGLAMHHHLPHLYPALQNIKAAQLPGDPILQISSPEDLGDHVQFMLDHPPRLAGQSGKDLQGLLPPGGALIPPEVSQLVEGIEGLPEGPVVGGNPASLQGMGHARYVLR